MRQRSSEWGAALSWPSGSEKFRLLCGILLAFFAAYALVFLAITAQRMASGPPSGDFFALWSAARFIGEHPPAQVYDAASLNAAQIALGMDPPTDYPFPYPPSLLLVLWPVGHLPYLPAYLVTIGVSLVLFVWATIGREWRSPMALAAVLAPTTTITIVAGQLGLFTGALLIGGFRLLASRPATAGMLFGLATYKPQMGLLVPAALVAARAWRAIAVAGATAAALVMVSGLAFGSAVWPAWAMSLVGYSREFASASASASPSGKIGHLMPTVAASMAALGVAPLVAGLAQFVVAIAAAWVVWCCFRRGTDALAGAAVLVATFLATPHALVYDMPPLATAVLWTIGERQRGGAMFGTGEVVVMILALIAPITLVAGPGRFPLVPLSLALLLALIARRYLRPDRQPA